MKSVEQKAVLEIRWMVIYINILPSNIKFVRLCCDVPCRVVLCCAVLYCAVLCCAVLCCAVLYCAVLCCAVPCRDVMCCAVQCRAVLCCVVLCCVTKPKGKYIILGMFTQITR